MSSQRLSHYELSEISHSQQPDARAAPLSSAPAAVAALAAKEIDVSSLLLRRRRRRLQFSSVLEEGSSRIGRNKQAEIYHYSSSNLHNTLIYSTFVLSLVVS